MNFEQELSGRGDIKNKLAYLMPIARSFYPACVADVICEAYSELQKVNTDVLEFTQINGKEATAKDPLSPEEYRIWFGDGVSITFPPSLQMETESACCCESAEARCNEVYRAAKLMKATETKTKVGK